MAGCVELINTAARASGDLPDPPWLTCRRWLDRYAFAGVRGKASDLAMAREYRVRLDSIVTSCEAGDEAAGDPSRSTGFKVVIWRQPADRRT